MKEYEITKRDTKKSISEVRAIALHELYQSLSIKERCGNKYLHTC